MHMILLLLALNPASQPVFDAVDRVEVNHFYNGDGCLVFDQIIWWDWNVSHSRWDVVDWRLLKDVRKVIEADQREWDRNFPDGPPYVAEWIGGHATPHHEPCGWVSEWYDEKTLKYRRVVAKTCDESWTDFDRELIEREQLPEQHRRRLR